MEALNKLDTYKSLIAEALSQVQNLYDSRKMNDVLDNIYSQAISG
ncbi:MAG: hypothetical protein WBG73_19430 [Coleofasciculaceae cyanobacterium]